MITIPERLRQDGFRFVLIRSAEKRPFEKDWTGLANYAWDDKRLGAHILDGGNYGVLCGPGGLRVLDYDDSQLVEELDEKLPRTFRVRTGGGGIHDYFICPDMEKVVLKADGRHLGELQGPGSQVVGPNSIHPNGERYKVERDIPIAEITKKEVKELLGVYYQKKAEEFNKNVTTYSSSLNITDVVSLAGMTKRGDEYQGEHPVHGSDGGMNFCVNPGKNTWHCFRCGSGGSIFEWIAVSEGIMDCDQAGKGSLRGSVFRKVLGIAKEKYGYKEPLRTKTYWDDKLGKRVKIKY